MERITDRFRYGRILERVLKDLKEEDSKKAVRILEWIACSFRLMKAHEIQDGIVLYMKDTELNERSKLLDGKFLGLCKPLIEQNPKNNTVDFVHFSAKEFVFMPLLSTSLTLSIDTSCVEPADQMVFDLSSITPKHSMISHSLP